MYLLQSYCVCCVSVMHIRVSYNDVEVFLINLICRVGANLQV